MHTSVHTHTANLIYVRQRPYTQKEMFVQGKCVVHVIKVAEEKKLCLYSNIYFLLYFNFAVNVYAYFLSKYTSQHEIQSTKNAVWNKSCCMFYVQLLFCQQHGSLDN